MAREYILKDCIIGSANTSRTFTKSMDMLEILPDGADIEVDVKDGAAVRFTIKVIKGEQMQPILEPFSSIDIRATGAFRVNVFDLREVN